VLVERDLLAAVELRVAKELKLWILLGERADDVLRPEPLVNVQADRVYLERARSALPAQVSSGSRCGS